MDTDRVYEIYHPVGEGFHAMNHCCKPGFVYESIGMVWGAHKGIAFARAQNDFNPEYAALGHRSTSVGDVLHDIIDDKYYVIEGVGFEEVDKLFIKGVII